MLIFWGFRGIAEWTIFPWVTSDEDGWIFTWKLLHKKVTLQQEDDYMARVRVLVIDQKKSNSEARRMAFEEII